jgi:CheY-like chemotaxis protein
MRLDSVLLVEDNENDILLTKRVIHQLRPDLSLMDYQSCEDALLHLNEAAVLPQVILLDLAFPVNQMDGIEFVTRLKSVRKLESIPVVIVTGMAADIIRAHTTNLELRYIIKPIKSQAFSDLITKLGFEL